MDPNDDSLDHADFPAWHLLPDYSEEIAARLSRAYGLISARGHLMASFLLAAREVQRTWGFRMAASQRLRVCYVLVLAYVADKQADLAFAWIEHAIELADRLDDVGALSRLLYLRGTLSFTALAFAVAADDFAQSRLLLHLLSDRAPLKDPTMELPLLMQEAGVRSFMGQLDHTRALLTRGRSLLTAFPGHVLEGATILWLEANMLRWQGSLELALRGAATAAALYTSLGPANSTARIQALTAEIALDLASALPPGADRSSFLSLARPHLALALQATRNAETQLGGDPNGRGLARLAEVRYQRLSGVNTDRVRLLERLARQAHQLNDHALLAQSFTALADELADQGEDGSAEAMYREALGVLDGSDLRALAIWPWRGLARLDRQQA